MRKHRVVFTAEITVTIDEPWSFDCTIAQVTAQAQRAANTRLAKLQASQLAHGLSIAAPKLVRVILDHDTK